MNYDICKCSKWYIMELKLSYMHKYWEILCLAESCELQMILSLEYINMGGNATFM